MASGLSKSFLMDSKKELEGIRVTPSEANDDETVPTFILTRMGNSNPKYRKAMETETQPFKRLIALEKLSNKKADEIRLKVFINTILIGWEHVQDEKGADVPYSPENAMLLMQKMPDLWEELQRSASNSELFKLEVNEAVAKN